MSWSIFTYSKQNFAADLKNIISLHYLLAAAVSVCILFSSQIIFTVVSEPNAQIGLSILSHAQIQGFCYGFVEFEDASAVQTAIEVI